MLKWGQKVKSLNSATSNFQAARLIILVKLAKLKDAQNLSKFITLHEKVNFYET